MSERRLSECEHGESGQHWIDAWEWIDGRLTFVAHDGDWCDGPEAEDE